MNKLAIKNVGPIKHGCDKEYININNLTVFLGPQGSGKSTIAKIYSSLSWLQKALVREELSISKCEQDGFFIKNIISYQGIQSYFKRDSYIHFIGKSYEFKYEKEQFTVKKIENNNYDMPKIMYVPAERNFIAAIPGPEYIKGLPKPLHSFLNEYEKAKRWVAKQFKVDLPIGSISYTYDQNDKKSYLLGNDFRTNLLHGSSGYQSLVPLFVVTEYLADLVLTKEGDSSYEDLSVAEKDNIEEKVKKMIESYMSVNDPETFEKLILKEAERITGRYSYKSFINIVEEPEQNLYPESQKQVLFNLIENLNKIQKNELVITSHSPYILNYITLCTEANRIYNNTDANSDIYSELNKIVPQKSSIDINSVNVYELDDKGNIYLIDKSQGFIDDSHVLNAEFEDINNNFANLLDME